MTTINEIKAARDSWREEHATKGVKISPYLEVSYEPLNEVPQIKLTFKVSGGWQNMAAYTIIGGADDGKVVEVLHWSPPQLLEYGATFYNGPREEYDQELGYEARPAIRGCGKLHISTIMFLCGLLIHSRQHEMGEAISKMYEKLDTD